jgi:uncharacterized repeat protein (TIGR01451 family)
MRKTAAFLIGVALVLGLGLALLHPSLRLIGIWLTPLLGTQFYVALSLLYLLLADPITYPVVLFVWLAVAFIGGVIVRRRLGGMLTMLFVWLLVVPMLALSVLGVAMNVGQMMEMVEGEEALGLVPPIPEGMTLTRLLETPMLGEIALDLLDMVGEGAEQEMVMDYIMGYAYRALSWAALRPLIVVVGALIGVEAGRIGQRFMPKPPSGFQSNQPAIAAALKTLLVVFILLGAALAPAECQLIDLGGSVYVEQLVAGTDGEGRVGLVDVFLETEDADVPEDVVAAIVASQEIQAAGLLSLLPLPEELDTESLLNLAPVTVYAVVYVDTPPEEATLRSAETRALLEDRLGVELVTLQAFELPEYRLDEATLPSMTAVVGYSDAEAAEVAEAFLGGVIEHGGLADGVMEAVSNGALVPGARGGSADGSVFISGFIRLEPFRYLLHEDPMLDMVMEDIEILFEEPLGFAVSGHYWEEGASAEGAGQSVDLAELLGLESLPSYSVDSDASFITLLKPNQTSAEDEFRVAVRFHSNLPPASPLLPMYGFMIEGFGNATYVEGTSVTANALRIALESPLPPRLTVSKTVARGRTAVGSQVEVTVTVTNGGNNAVQEVEIDDSLTLLGYAYASDLRGSATKTVASLAPGASETLTYSFKLSRPGVYKLRPVEVSYVSGGETCCEVSDRPTVETGPPGLVQACFTMRGDLVKLIDLAAEGRGETVVNAATLVVGALVLLNLALTVRRWRLGAAPSLEPV